MKKIYLFLILIAIILVNLNLNANENNNNEIESNTITINDIEFRKFATMYHKMEIRENEYQKIKSKKDNYKNTNYYIYLNPKYQIDNKINACGMYNFNQNYISGIYLLRESGKDEQGFSKLYYKEGYILYKEPNKPIIKINIRDAEYFKCGDLDIKDCNKTGNDGMNCLSELPNECEFIVSSKDGMYCIDLNNDKFRLMEYGCDKKSCDRMDSAVMYFYD